MQAATQTTVPMEVHLQVLAQMADLKARLAWFERQFFGRKSERFVPDTPGQLLLDFGAASPGEAVVEAVKQQVEAHERSVPAKQPTHQGREVIPADLPRISQTIEPEGDTGGMVRIGEDISEQIEYEAGRIWVRQTIRPRYARPEAQQAEAEAAAEAEGQAPPRRSCRPPRPTAPSPA